MVVVLRTGRTKSLVANDPTAAHDFIAAIKDGGLTGCDGPLGFVEDDAGARLELIRPLSVDSPVARALTHGGGLNHICYQVPDLDSSVQSLLATDAKLVRAPQPAVAFNGRRVAFLYTRQRELVEFVEAERG